MNVKILHKTVDITDHVISYQTEQKICSGIGSLSISIEGTFDRTFTTWDRIDIYEEGILKNRYFISSINKQEPSGKIDIKCQDNSKRLSDYFIIDSYMITYPTTARYWIEKFLAEAGVEYTFTTDSNGSLLSNNSALGLMSAYEQIVQLLQISGWYIYFDVNGKAVIGSITADLANPKDTFDNTEIIEIALLENDKMLRNRAVVWGTWDEFLQQYVFADLSVTTPWNYDDLDKRAVVIANSNIGTVGAANSLATNLLTEFARITIEKHLTVTGTRNLNIGDIICIKSDVYTGNAMITTLGTSLDSRGGLVTNIIADERCPRLFAFFSFEDYVYAGRWGAGVSRKPLKFLETWLDYSVNLTNINIVDLYKNNGVLSCVDEIGQAYSSLDIDGYWRPITISGLICASGINTEPTLIESGIKARCVIQDKLNNFLRIGCDNHPMDNPEEYGSITLSGIGDLSEIYSWIVEADPRTGTVTTNFPITVDDYQEMIVLDIENDGRTDYVSVLTNSGYQYVRFENSDFNFGRDTNSFYGLTASPYKNTEPAYSNNITVALGAREYYESYQIASMWMSDIRFILGVIEEPYDKEIIYITLDNTLKVVKVIKYFDEETGAYTVEFADYGQCEDLPIPENINVIGEDVLTPGMSSYSGFIGIKKNTDILYDVYFFTTEDNLKFKKISCNISSNTYEEETVAQLPEEANGYVYFYIINGIFNFVNLRHFYHMFFGQYKPEGFDILVGSFSINTEEFEVKTRFSDLGDWPNHIVKGGDAWVGENNGEFIYRVPYMVFDIFDEEGIDIYDKTLYVKSESTTYTVDSFTSTGYSESFEGPGSYPYKKIFNSKEFIFFQRFDHNWGNSKYLKMTNRFIQLVGGDAVQAFGQTTAFKLTGKNCPFKLLRDYNVPSIYYKVDPATYKPTEVFTLKNGYFINNIFPRLDDVSNKLIIKGWNPDDEECLIEADIDGNIYREITGDFPYIVGSNAINLGNFFILFDIYTSPNAGIYSCQIMYLDNDYMIPIGPLAHNLVLKREGTAFSIIKDTAYFCNATFSGILDTSILTSGLFYSRLDCSLFNPLVIISSGIQNLGLYDTNTGLLTSLLYDTEGFVGDFRYTIQLDDELIYSTDLILTLSGILKQMPIYGDNVISDLYVPSGEANLNFVESSNYSISGQYMFIATKGSTPTFYQRSPETMIFEDQTFDLGESPITIIRLDDRI